MRKLYSLGLPLMGLLVFSLAVFMVSNQEFKGIMDDFLSQRTDVMQNVMDGSLDYESGAASLSLFESGQLLEQDLKAMKNWNDTCYDRISGFQIGRCQVVNENEIGVVLSVAVIWEMYDLEGKYTLPENYLFVLEKNPAEGEWKLCEMRIRESVHS